MQVHYIRYCCYSYYHQMGCIRKFPHRTNQSHSLRQTHTKQIEILIREPSSTEIEKRVYIKILRYYMNIYMEKHSVIKQSLLLLL